MKNSFSDLSSGGEYTPSTCSNPDQVAIIVPYRNRTDNLKVFIQYMHPFLMRQNIHYKIYVINQGDDKLFNRAMLFNVGFKEALKDFAWPCFVFSDVDHLPEDDRNLYKCENVPKHMGVSIDTGGYELYYEGFFGGVFAIKREQFQDVNGASNQFWGWGGEDDDIIQRIQDSGLSFIRIHPDIGRYTTTKHGDPIKNEEYSTDRWVFA